jgi:hypothetical protein
MWQRGRWREEERESREEERELEWEEERPGNNGRTTSWISTPYL